MAGASPVQTQEDIVPPAPVPLGFRWAGVVLAPAVAASVQLVLTGPFGLDLMVPESLGSSTLQELPLLLTTLSTFVLALVSWLAIALLERGLGEERGRRIWMTVAFALLAVSIAVVATYDISTGAQWGMVALHSAVALVLIPTMSARGQG